MKEAELGEKKVSTTNFGMHLPESDSDLGGGWKFWPLPNTWLGANLEQPFWDAGTSKVDSWTL